MGEGKKVRWEKEQAPWGWGGVKWGGGGVDGSGSLGLPARPGDGSGREVGEGVVTAGPKDPL